MTTIATIGPAGSHAWQAARQYLPDAELLLLPHPAAAMAAFAGQRAELALLPAYNTRTGRNKEFFRLVREMEHGYWIDNLLLPVHLSLAALDDRHELKVLVARQESLHQCEDYLADHFPNAVLTAVRDLERAAAEIRAGDQRDHGVIETEEALRRLGFTIREREISPFNRTRFALLGRELPPASGYDATTVITRPLKDRVGLLFEILAEFNRRAINLLAMHTDTDPRSQELLFTFELEGHIDEPEVREALERIEHQVIKEPGAIKLLGSYPRLDMRIKRIHRLGFIGSGEMSRWFARRLESEGYQTLVTGRSSELRPEEMIPQVEVVLICVPISATPAAIERYAPLLKPGQALILLAGEAEHVLETALQCSNDQVEVMLVHNLWGPQAASMKDKNVSVVRTRRSGVLCSEFSAFLYKHGARISQDPPRRHDLLMGVSQKLPTAISMALAMTLKDNRIEPAEIGSHATLTSLYTVLSMARIHFQNPRTYAEILACPGQGRAVARDFAANLVKVLDLADQQAIAELGRLIEENREYLGEDFLEARMEQALAVDKTLGRLIRR